MEETMIFEEVEEVFNSFNSVLSNYNLLGGFRDRHDNGGFRDRRGQNNDFRGGSRGKSSNFN